MRGRSSISNNTGTTEASYAGGVYAAEESSVKLFNTSSVDHNNAGYGSGMYIDSDSTLLLAGPSRCRTTARLEAPGESKRSTEPLLTCAARPVGQHRLVGQWRRLRIALRGCAVSRGRRRTTTGPLSPAASCTWPAPRQSAALLRGVRRQLRSEGRNVRPMNVSLFPPPPPALCDAVCCSVNQGLH